MDKVLEEAISLIDGGGFHYAVYGGYAIELFLDRNIRKHADVDISVYWHERDRIIQYMQHLG